MLVQTLTVVPNGLQSLRSSSGLVSSERNPVHMQHDHPETGPMCSKWRHSGGLLQKRITAQNQTANVHAAPEIEINIQLLFT